VVTYPDSQVGCLFEHSPIDGHTVLRLCTEVDAYIRSSSIVSMDSTSKSSCSSHLKWDLSPALQTSIKESTHNVQNLISSLETSALPFSNYGKQFITSKKLSPDAYCQMAFQLAYYKLHGRTESTYESSSTKKFLSGRTETIRSATKDSVKFTKTWTDSSSSSSDKILSLRTATETHTRLANMCKNGSGVDRHLFGMRNLAVQKQQRLPRYTIPSLFRDPAYSNYCSNVLSTSNVSSPVFNLFGFGPVVGNGLGIAYNIHDKDLRFNVTSWIGEAHKFTSTLEETLNDMKKLLD